MPTTSAAESPAAAAAFSEATLWAGLAGRWHPDRHVAIWNDLRPVESLVIPEVDPSADLAKRARRWGYSLERGDLGDIALFAAALAKTEGEAWRDEDRSVATLAFEARRFLAADRLLPWAVPWLRAAARCFPESRKDAEGGTQALLEIGERRRLAPLLSGAEGLVPPGHDGYGPIDEAPDLERRISSLWGGMVVFDRSMRSLTGDSSGRRNEWRHDAETAQSIATLYEVAAVRWQRLAERHPGTARFWIDLAQRCLVTTRAATGVDFE